MSGEVRKPRDLPFFRKKQTNENILIKTNTNIISEKKQQKMTRNTYNEQKTNDTMKTEKYLKCKTGETV